MAAETTHITVIVAGRSYPLIVEKAKEQNVLDTVKTINESITKFQVQYQSKDKQDCLVMTLLEMALGSTSPELRKSAADIQSIRQALADLDRSLEAMLA